MSDESELPAGPQSAQTLMVSARTWDDTVRLVAEGAQVTASLAVDGKEPELIGRFDTLAEALSASRVFDLGGDDEVEVTLHDECDLSVDEFIALVHEVNSEYQPSGEQGDIVFDPILTVNGRRFFAVLFDDDTWELIEDADSYDPIASVRLFESMSRTSGYFSLTVGRLPTGAVLMLDQPDEDPGWAQALRAEISDVEAARRWLTGSEDWVQSLFIAAYRNGRTIEVGSDFDTDWSDTLEIGHVLKLSPSEQSELWALLG